MTEWFQERYISRAEHEAVVAYYAKLVAQLYRQVTDLRAVAINAQAIDAQAIDARAINSIIAHGKHKAEREMRRAVEDSSGEPGSNVVVVDFRSRLGIDLPN